MPSANARPAREFNRQGNTLLGQRRPREAIEAYDRAIAAEPALPDPHNNRAIALAELRRLDEAVENYDRAIALSPRYAEAHANRGVALVALGRLDEAEESLDRALACRPDYPDARWNKGLVRLMKGDFAEGWRLYEERWRRAGAPTPRRPLPQPPWLGEEPVAGKTILAYAEQGLGDTIQFCRYAKVLADQGARVVLEVQEPLLRLLQGLPGAAKVLAHGEAPPPFDLHVPLASLPYATRRLVHGIPAPTRYLFSRGGRIAKWRARLGPRTRPRLGIAWSSSSNFRNDAVRSLRLAQFVQALPAEGWEIVCLQKELKPEDRPMLAARPDLRWFGEELETFDDTAALVEQMDLVLSTCTSIPHLAAALGKPTWILLSQVPDWRWMLEREDSPWYPTVRLFRQDRRDDWSGALARVHAALRERVGLPEAPAPAPSPFSSRSAAEAMREAEAAYGERDFPHAEACCREAIVADPANVDALNLLGCLAGLGGRFPEAVAWLEKSVALDPSNANALRNLGNACRDAKRPKESEAAFARALALKPEDPESWMARGLALAELQRLQEAMACFDRVLAYQAGNAAALRNRGITLGKLGRHDEAIESYDRALKLAPEFAAAHFSRGIAMWELRRLDEAIASYDRALEFQPDHVQAPWNKSLALLLQGRLAEGWPLYEWRWKQEKGQREKRDFPGKPWLGDAPLEGKAILLHDEQGLGDVLQFCRYAPQVKALGATVILEVPRPLKRLAGTLPGVDVLVGRGEPIPVHDCHCPLLSLPLAFRTTLESIPSVTPYLRPSPAALKRWATRLGEKRRPRVAFVWSGRPEHPNDHHRSLPLGRILACVPEGIDAVALQKEVRPADRTVMEANPRLRFFGPQMRDFDDTAAIAALSDLVVSVDTSAAHLAGALGRPLWILLPWLPDWRWLLDRKDTPWYPGARLYRQPARGQWDPVLERLRRDLAALAAKGSHA